MKETNNRLAAAQPPATALYTTLSELASSNVQSTDHHAIELPRQRLTDQKPRPKARVTTALVWVKTTGVTASALNFQVAQKLAVPTISVRLLLHKYDQWNHTDRG